MTKLCAVQLVKFTIFATSAIGSSFNFTGLVGSEGSVGSSSKIFISNSGDNRIEISRSGGATELETPKVERDSRGVDGNLVVDLGNNRKLIVSSAFNELGLVEYHYSEGGSVVEMKPSVQFYINP